MNGITERCADYFKTKPGYHRILEQIFRKYKGYGRPVGKISLPDATQEECDAAKALFGRSFSVPLQIKTADFEAALQNTPYKGVVLKEVLEVYFGTQIQTKRELQDQIDTGIQYMVEQVKAAVPNETCHRWLDDLSRKVGEGYQLVRNYMNKNETLAHKAILQTCKSVDWLEKHTDERVRLAVLSASATSDPHALDGNNLSGKLFLHLLARRKGVAFPTSAEDRVALYYECGILCDSISSCVTQVGACLYVGEEEHPAYRAFRIRNESATLTLTNLSGLTAANGPSGKVYLVENQMVFTQLCDHAERFHSPLICTSGQPTIAVIRLLDMFVAADTELFYSGDFDGKGLSIAAQLLKRYPEKLHLWHITTEDYSQACSDVKLSEESRTLLRSCAETRLAPIAKAVGDSGYVGYQELLLPKLEADLVCRDEQ